MVKKNENKDLYDVGAERSVLAGLIQHGPKCFYDICDIIKTSDFFKTINQQVFHIVKFLIEEKDVKNLDLPTILSTAKSLGYQQFEEQKLYSEYLESLFDSSPSHENTIQLSILIYKLSFVRQAIKCVNNIKGDLGQVNGNENIDQLISKIEEPIFDFTAKLTDQDKILSPLTENLDVSISQLSNDTKDMVGLSTGYPNWDYCVGGGLRRGTINVIGARAKGAKSMMCLNVAKNMSRHKIPVLYLDTELTKEVQLHRLLSMCTKIDLTHIETGKFTTIKEEKDAVEKLKKKIEALPIYHCSSAGKSIESILSIARRWISKKVGFDNNGLAKPCLVIFDYLKLMNADDIKGSMAEHQLLGFVMTELHNFALKFGIPILAAVQLNRDGVEKEGSQFISASDRILWLCSNFSILKNKSDEELKECPPKFGNKKLIVCDTRYGPGMQSGEYINMLAELKYARLDEGEMFPSCIKTSFQQNEHIKDD